MSTRLRPLALVALAVMSLTPAVPVAAQEGRPRAPDVISPEVHPDRRVTLRLLAPKADSVRLTGEIMDGRAPVALARDTSGVWSVTVGPMAPDVYTYAFDVDGVRVPDPLNGYVKTGPGGGFATSSQVEVPGDGPQYYDARPVPHGLVSMLQYDSRAIAAPRRALVYTPPGYAAGRGTYPMVVLMHGIGETEVDWVMAGRANQILDNLIADGRARPMVVVMPLGHARGSQGLGPVPTMKPGEPMRGDPFAYATIERDLLEDLLPAVEREFRVSRAPDDRAIMGLSLGGSQAVRIGLNRLDRFRWIAGFSAAFVEPDPATGFTRVLADAAGTNRQVRMLRLMIGEGDWLLAGNRTFAERLTTAGVRHELVVEPGRHEWRLWRKHLHDILPLLFQKPAPSR